MNDEPTMIGRVLRASTTHFTVGCTQPIAAQEQTLPPFGALIKALNDSGATYGLVYNVAVEDDPFVRQLVAAGVENEEIIADQRQRRQVPIVVEVLVAGYGVGDDMVQRLPPRPPGTLDRIFTCTGAEIGRFTKRHDWLRTVLGSGQPQTDALVVAALRMAAQARPPTAERDTYLIGAGRELARLLALDLTRLEGILQQLR